MYRKILVPLDGSSFAECSLAHVKEIAKGCQVPVVTLMSIVDTFHNFPDVATGEIRRSEEEVSREQAQKYLETIASNLQKDGLNTEIAIDKGPAAEKILDYIEKNGVDLVILSTHGRSGVTRFLMGGTADRIIRHVKVPVLAVSPESCRI
jgi:nucleotide-binding universal stress UspA family protein